MSVKMSYTYGYWIVVPYKTNSLHFIAWVITYKIVELVIKFCHNAVELQRAYSKNVRIQCLVLTYSPNYSNV